VFDGQEPAERPSAPNPEAEEAPLGWQSGAKARH
jgi:hypothetical protein